MMKWFASLVVIVCVGGLWWYMHNNTEILSSTESAQTYTGGTYEERKGTPDQDGQTVLFFHADRCSSCMRIEKKIQKSGVPSGLHIRKVNYDTENELKEKYNVTTQTTFVVIDKEGKMITRRVGARSVKDILQKIQTTQEQKPRQKVAQEGSNVRHEAYFAGGCFWCMEGPFESLRGVQEAIAGYIGGTSENANYTNVSSGKTQHREAVKVIYDPALVSYEELLDVYWRQIDYTDEGGQFADRGYQYTTAIYYANEKQKISAQKSFDELQKSDTASIATKIIAFSSFYPAEEYHQNYYLKQSTRYNQYKEGSGRAAHIRKQKDQKNTKLTELQRRVTQEGYTEKPFENEYRNEKREGIYVDIVDGTPLFSSTDKFDSGTGWPSFTKPLSLDRVNDRTDTSHGMQRTEIKSTKSDSHLGHVFNDGPNGSQRYCINSAALHFVPREEMEYKGYGEYLQLFK